MAKRRVALGLLASASISGVLAFAGVPAYGQSTAGVGNSGQGSASSGGNSSVGNNSNNAAANTTTSPAPEPSLIGSVLGLALNLTTGSANASNGTSSVNAGGAQASGNTSDTGVGQQSANSGAVGTVFSPFATQSQGAGVSNSGSAAASTGGNSGVGNNSTNLAANTQNVSAGLIAVGLTLGTTASNTSNGTSTINTGPASAAGNTATNAVEQTSVGGGGGIRFGPGSRFSIGGGAACDGFFGLGGQRATVNNSGSASANTGDNASVGNQSSNAAVNQNTTPGGAITVNVPGLLGINSANASDGQSAITTGEATASGNRSTNAVDQTCIEQASFVSPPVIHPGFHHFDKFGRPGVRFVAGHQQQLARTGVDPFVLGLVAFALLFGGFLFMVWERVEAIPAGGRTPTA